MIFLNFGGGKSPNDFKTRFASCPLEGADFYLWVDGQQDQCLWEVPSGKLRNKVKTQLITAPEDLRANPHAIVR